MAKRKSKKSEVSTQDDFTSDLIKSLNKEKGARVAYNLAVDDSPTHVKRWISTGSQMLDYICANQKGGGLPEGRIVEIFGPPSIGKSHIATQIARSTQKMGGIVVYIDTENATSVENLGMLGVDVSKRFVYVDTHCTEEVLSIAEATIMKAKAMDKDIPVTIVWDSVAASSPKAELLGDYDKESIGLQARAISKGMRKITGVIANQNVLFVILNQIRTKIGVMYGDPDTTPGGKAIPFHASVRLRLKSVGQIKVKKDGVDQAIGIKTRCQVVKNRMGPPLKTIDYDIYFESGIDNYGGWLNVMKQFKLVGTAGAWYTFTRKDGTDIKFLSKDFEKKLEDIDGLKDEIYEQICDAYILKYKPGEDIGIDDVEISEEFVSEEG